MEHVTPELIIAVAVQRLIGSRADLDTAQNAVMQAGNALVNAATDLLEATNPPESALDASAAATARETDGVPEPASKPWGELNIVFDGFPGPDGGEFVEVEDANGRSVCAGEWIKRPDGLCALRILSPAPALLSACQDLIRYCVTPDGMPDVGKGRTTEQQAAYDAARAAIAQATANPSESPKGSPEPEPVNQALLEACRVASRSEHHPACPIATGKGATTYTHDDCTCHVKVARAAIAQAESTMRDRQKEELFGK